ncbi:MAG: M48 family metalloprotease [bacterium]|nr:M48 family metalloprotease [bacterium]
MNLYAQKASNVRRTWALILGFFFVAVAIGYAISWYYQNPAILIVAVVIAFATNIYAYWASDKLVLSLTKARPASREEFFDLYTVTENLAITAGLPKPKLYVIDDSAPNAFATGRDEKHAVVCATTGLLAMMSRTELEGVIAHELSHIKNRDMLLMTVAVVLAGFIALIANIFIHTSFMGGGRRNNNNGGAIFAVIAIVAIVLAPIAAKLIQLAISRRREYHADASGALLTRYPAGLASALEKIGNYQAPMKNANLATAHLFIGDPFGSTSSPPMRSGSSTSGSSISSTGGLSGRIERLFSTHPPIRDRIKLLLSQGV